MNALQRPSALALSALITALSLCSLGVPAASAQSVDMAAERARIANERIQRDLRRRQSTEESEDGTEQSQSAPPGGPSSSVPYAAAQRPAPVAMYTPEAPASAAGTAVSPSAGSSSVATADDVAQGDYTRTLSQLRVLGELRDAGYLTDDEFSRIKTRIISSVF